MTQEADFLRQTEWISQLWKQNRLRSTICRYQSFFGGMLIFLLPPRVMSSSFLKLWWDAEWKQMRACQRWQEKLISSRCLCGFWEERDPEAGPGVTQPAPLQHPTPTLKNWKVMGRQSVKTNVWRESCKEVIPRKVNQRTTEPLKVTRKICKTVEKVGQTTWGNSKTKKNTPRMATRRLKPTHKSNCCTPGIAKGTLFFFSFLVWGY